MGVMATYCQLCGMPVHHDHYVPDGNRWRIYRASGDRNTKPAVAFMSEHSWLIDAIGLRRSRRQEPAWVEGEVHDGGFDPDLPYGSTGDGIDERVALHRNCFQILGTPDVWNPAGELPRHAVLLPYKKQLFDFQACLAGPESWRLTDPTHSTSEAKRNSARIQLAADHYHGRRRYPSLGEFLEFLTTGGCTRVEFKPDEIPVYIKDGSVVRHPFEPISADRCADILHSLLSEEDIAKLADTGRAQTIAEMENVGRFESTVLFQDGRYIGHIVFSPASKR